MTKPTTINSDSSEPNTILGRAVGNAEMTRQSPHQTSTPPPTPKVAAQDEWHTLKFDRCRRSTINRHQQSHLTPSYINSHPPVFASRVGSDETVVPPGKRVKPPHPHSCAGHASLSTTLPDQLQQNTTSAFEINSHLNSMDLDIPPYWVQTHAQPTLRLLLHREVHSARDDSLAIVPTPPANGMSSTTSHNSLAIATTTYNHARTIVDERPVYTTQSLANNTNPQSWLEMSLQNYSLLFMMTIDNEKVVVYIHNPLDIAQIMTGRMRTTMVLYDQYQTTLAPVHVQMGPLPIPITFPPHWMDPYVPMPSPMSNSLADLSFYPPYLSLIPWIHSEWNLYYPPPTPLPSLLLIPNSPVSGDHPKSKTLSSFSNPSLSSGPITSYTSGNISSHGTNERDADNSNLAGRMPHLRAQRGIQKKLFLNAPPELKECCIDLHPTSNPHDGKFVVLITPMLCQTPVTRGP
ncbi:hypothetical protein T459_16972 [Capsicum annuum]|uniref:Uncharacterized protein n=1 Tax=Capsicum annuum TaxID=4072 RepID=A0A2G2ZA88_CAPAN|nr:hypothetical protein T459_16972 [Capsicum annuum]